MTKIERLTDEQVADMDRHRDEWLRIGLSTEPVDKEEAKAAVSLAYQCAGLRPPDAFIFLGSPMAGAMGAAMLNGAQVWDQVRGQVEVQVGPQVGNQVWDQVGDQVRDQVEVQVGNQVWAQVCAEVGGQVADQVADQVRDQVRDQVCAEVCSEVRDQVWVQVGAQVRDQVRVQVGAQVWDQVGRAIYGPHDAGWLCFYAFFHRHFGLSDKARGLFAVARSCGWIWPFDGTCIITERPARLLRNEANQLHSEAGPAVLYPDGFSAYAWNGVRVPAHWIEDKASLDPAEVLKTENVEQRAAGCAIIGWPRMSERLDRKVIDGDPESDVGALVELTLPGLPDPGRFLMAKCPRNGTICEGVPRVSDIDGTPIETAIAAQAWRDCLPESEYSHAAIRT